MILRLQTTTYGYIYMSPAQLPRLAWSGLAWPLSSSRNFQQHISQKPVPYDRTPSLGADIRVHDRGVLTFILVPLRGVSSINDVIAPSCSVA